MELLRGRLSLDVQCATKNDINSQNKCSRANTSSTQVNASQRRVEFAAVRYLRRDNGGKTGLRSLGYDAHRKRTMRIVELYLRKATQTLIPATQVCESVSAKLTAIALRIWEKRFQNKSQLAWIWRVSVDKHWNRRNTSMQRNAKVELGVRPSLHVALLLCRKPSQNRLAFVAIPSA